MEVYKDRLWVAGATVISFSAPGNGVDFSAAGGGGSFAYYGDQLTGSYTALAASAGYLFLFGDSSVQTIYNVQLSGDGSLTNPYLTTFLNSNVDPQVGQGFFRPVGMWSRAFTLFNGAGLFRLYGGNARMISNKLSPLFVNNVNTNVVTPTMCPVDIFGTRWMLFNLWLIDPFGAERTLMLAFTDQTQEASAVQNPIWTTASQKYNIIEIAGYESEGVCHAYGHDGTSLYQLFAGADATLTKRISTNAYTGTNALTNKDFRNVYLKFKDNEGHGVSINGYVTAQDGASIGGTADCWFEGAPLADTLQFCRVDGKGTQMSVDLTSKSPDFSIARLSVTFTENNLWGH